MALLMSVMIVSLAFGKTIIGITAKSNTMTTPMKIVQSITFSFFNCDPPNIIFMNRVFNYAQYLLIHKKDNNEVLIIMQITYKDF